MIKFILGTKGSGKTRWLIENANEDLKSGNGNIAFVEVDDDHIFSLDYNVRLINATDYKLDSVDAICGFLCGMMAMDYDLEKVYVDGIYKVVDLNVEELEYIENKLSKIKDSEKIEFFINVDLVKEDLSDKLKAMSIEVTN